MTNGPFPVREELLEYALAVTLVVLAIAFLLLLFGSEMMMLVRTLNYLAFR